MPGYVKKSLLRFQHIAQRKQRAPHQWNQPVYGCKTQFTPESDTSPPVSASAKTLIQQVVGTFLYYGLKMTSPCLLPLVQLVLNKASPQRKPCPNWSGFLITAQPTQILSSVTMLAAWYCGRKAMTPTYLKKTHTVMLEDSSTSVIAHLLTVPHQKPTPKRNGMIYALVKIM